MENQAMEALRRGGGDLVEADLMAAVSTSETRPDLVSSNGTYLAYASENGQVVHLLSLRMVEAPALKLLAEGRGGVTAIHVGSLPAHQGRDALLEKKVFASTRSKILVWSVEECYASRERGEGARRDQLDLPESDGPPRIVSHLQTDDSMRWLAAATDSEILVFALRSGQLSLRLDAHSLQVNALRFDARQGADRLIAASDDRTFTVWDLRTKELSHQSAILGAHPLSCLALDPSFPRMAVGSTDGLIRFFDLTHPGCALVQTLDLPLCVRKKFGEPRDRVRGEEAEDGVVTAGARSNRKESGTRWKRDPPVGMGSVSSVSALFYVRPAPAHGAGGLLPAAPKLVACTTQMLVVLDAYTYDAVAIVPFSDHSYRGCPNLVRVETPRAFSAEARGDGGAVVCMASAFTNAVSVVRVGSGWEEGRGAAAEGQGEDAGCEGRGISVFPTSPPKRLSRLYRAIEKENKAGGASSFEAAALGGRTRKSATTKTRDKPVTFHSRIKSSGYGKVEPLRFLGRQVQSRTLPKRPSNNLKTGRLLRQYPLDCDPVHEFQDHHALEGDAPVHGGPILRCRFCPDGSRIVTASVDKSLRALRLPLARHKGEGESFLGHGGAVLDACWSHGGGLLLSASSDRTARLWSVRKSQALLTISGAGGSQQKGRRADSFNADVKAVSFFHLDKLLVLACGSRLHFYRYDLGGSAKSKDDIARMHQPKTSHHVLELNTEAQSVTDFDCHNGFISNLLVAGTSAKTVEVFDADAGRLVRRNENAHDRGIHTITLNATSPYASHDQGAHELFLSAASDSSVKMWDLRASRSVRCFAGHLNRQNPIGVRFSPCMKYIACGSEDKVGPTNSQRRHGQTESVCCDSIRLR